MIDSIFVDQLGEPVDPQDITAGSEILPIIKISYFRNGNKFGLNLTLLKGMVYPRAKRPSTLNYADLDFDV